MSDVRPLSCYACGALADADAVAYVDALVMISMGSLPPVWACRRCPDTVNRGEYPSSECSICRRWHGREIEHACE